MSSATIRFCFRMEFVFPSPSISSTAELLRTFNVAIRVAGSGMSCDGESAPTTLSRLCKMQFPGQGEGRPCVRAMLDRQVHCFNRHVKEARRVSGHAEVFWRAERRSKSDWSVRFLN
jgi:hypothetical protein